MKINKKKTILLKYLIGFFVASAIFFLTISLRNIYIATDQQQIYRFLSDGFSIPGVLFLCFGILLWLANLGSFNGIGYAMKHLVLMLIPLSRKKHETYAQYLETRKTVSGFGFLFVIGGLFLLLGIVFLMLF